jgi:ubiquinone/menaquinone biosynthesis C-methylase UbiE
MESRARNSASSPPNFDRLARLYAPLERLSFGGALQRRRLCYLGDPRLSSVAHALVLGDGDGRFCAALLERYPFVRVTAVDASAAMLAELQRRVKRRTPRAMLELHHADLRTWSPPHARYDLVAAHFFFDCLSTPDVAELVERVGPSLAPNAHWLVSDFAIPAGRFVTPFARLLLRALYLAFAVLARLRVSALPNYESALIAAGFACGAAETAFGGTLRSELWTRAARV